ncbi:MULTISPECIES: pilus assembly protein PilP [Marichromatium]|uniref:Type IV pilus assembly protein PilP n=1 Tax=Marichromatium gracile TaxID=1048 RepID=A0A4R4AM38_MARGR|nr:MULTISPECIES: pilus assembly protein PilP [Marichromatium]MBO8085206.1 pilus assembly protein PilP [Marichromatium sp.]MBK1707566.1 pilus assembly protein PilP [Marichromatium gracile]RNE91964.1 pilus assembly protein PilP [Marichromatium sp. AB31]RNE92917.1 pilus assembly protein PilP [Marichromatium sp. AB32]TCW39916.1 type IV pilus assembly protein PilP [Marichromatium gracile]
MNRIRLSVPVAALLVLAGCGGGNMSDLERYVGEVKSRPPRPVEPLPEIQPVDSFVFDPGDRRDPFVPDRGLAPLAAEESDNGLAPDPNRRKEVLEGYALDALRMVGTLEQTDLRWALVRTQDGVLHRVRVGNYMGLNNGQIVSIDEDSIELIEIVADAPGQWRERDAALELSE